jgi:hypothetical protein
MCQGPMNVGNSSLFNKFVFIQQQKSSIDCMIYFTLCIKEFFSIGTE